MSTVAIVGAGPLGGALTDALARRSRITEVRLIDPHGRVAEGKALDILQSAPVEQFSTRVTSSGTLSAAAGADVIVLADLLAEGEVTGESGLALIREIARMETKSPLLFAGGGQWGLIERAIGELRMQPGRVLGSAPLALESAVVALVAALADVSPRDLSIGIAGVPPK